jgi:hypothetical protein
VGAAIGPLASAEGARDDQVVLHRDGSKAVPFDPVVGGGNDPVLHRDGSKAVPFVAATSPQTGSADSGFDSGDAMIAASACGLMLLGFGALLLVRRSRSRVQRGHRVAA